VCFYGECKYYCDSHHAVCGSGHVVEGSCAAWLPTSDHRPRRTWPNPWAQLYTKRGKLPRWKTEPRYCDEVRSEGPYDSGRRLLDVVDIAIFDFLIGSHTLHLNTSRATFSKVPRKILGKLLILGATDTQEATSSRGYSATVEHCTKRPINSVQRSNRKLCSSSSSSNSSSKIRSFPKIFLGTFENAAAHSHYYFSDAQLML